MIDLSMIKFDEKGLVPAIAQDYKTGEVVMQAYMNKEALELTVTTGQATYFSRSRQEIWVKGKTSGNTQKVISIKYDCDHDSILLLIDQKGVACHTGAYSCFFNSLIEDGNMQNTPHVLYELYDLVKDRMVNPKEDSYTNYLLSNGVDKIGKKVVEEACEVIIGAKNADNDETTYELADLFYHVIVLMAQQGITFDQVFAELKNRR